MTTRILSAEEMAERWPNGVTLAGGIASFAGAPAPKPRPSTNLFATRAAQEAAQRPAEAAPKRSLSDYQRTLEARRETALRGFLDPFEIYKRREAGRG